MRRLTAFLAGLALTLAAAGPVGAATPLASPSEFTPEVNLIDFELGLDDMETTISAVGEVGFSLTDGTDPWFRNFLLAREFDPQGPGSIANVPAATATPADLVITLPRALNRVGFELLTGDNFDQVMLEFRREGSVVDTASFPVKAANQFYFYGFETAAIFDEVRLHVEGSGGFALDNLRFESTAANQPPVVDAGPDQTVNKGDTVTLSGSASDPENDTPLTYAWSFIEPATGAPTLTGADTLTPSFTADERTDYVLELEVTDALGAVGTDRVTVSVRNLAPVADAGPDQSAHPPATVTLTGSGDDPDGDFPLTYHWSIVSQPAGSSPTLFTEPDNPEAQLEIDAEGEYELQLVVKDATGKASAPDAAVVSTFNSAPVADAGPDQVIDLVDTVVTLDGSGSADADEDPLTYAWSLESRPAGSAASLSDSGAVTPTFTADVNGTYEFSLVVTDPFGLSSAPDTVTVSFDNVPPVADAGADQTVTEGDPVTLDGSASHDANGDPLSYAWTLISTPTDSEATLGTPTAQTTTLETDFPGAYVVQLVVNDGRVDSEPDQVTVTVEPKPQSPSDRLAWVIGYLRDMPDDHFTHKHARRSLVRRIRVATKLIERGHLVSPAAILGLGVLSKTNGCARNGSPDRTDWLRFCVDQDAVYPVLHGVVMELIERIKENWPHFRGVPLDR